MEHQVIDNFKDIIFKIVKTYGIHNYNVNFKSDEIKIQLLINPTIINNIIIFFNTLLKSKIYKHKQQYWTFTELYNLEIIPDYNYMQLNAITKVNFVKLTSYMQILPIEMLTIIISYMVPPELSNFCTYLQTWGDFCTEDIYKFMYRNKFVHYFNLIQPYLKYENNTWHSRYSSVLFEEIYNLNELSIIYKKMYPRNLHIAFILMIYNLLNDINYKNIELVYRYNPNLLKEIISNMNGYKINQVKDILKLKNVNIYNKLF